MFKQPTHQQKRFETKTNVTDSLSVDFEMSDHSPEVHNVSVMDNQTSGDRTKFTAIQEVEYIVDAIAIRNDIANAASALTNARFLTRNY